MLKKLEKSIFNYIVFGAVSICIITLSICSKKFSSIYYILIVATLSLMINLITKLRNKGKEETK